MPDSPTKEEMLKEARSLLGMLYTDMGEPDFTARFLPHWRARIAAFMQGREPTYDPKTAPVAVSSNEQLDMALGWLRACGNHPGEHHATLLAYIERLRSTLQRIAYGGVTDCMIAQDIAANAIVAHAADEIERPARDAEHCDYPDCEQHWRFEVERLRSRLDLISRLSPRQPTILAVQLAKEALAGVAVETSAAPKRAYYETHDAPHCPTCGCGLDMLSGARAPKKATACTHVRRKPSQDELPRWQCADCGAYL